MPDPVDIELAAAAAWPSAIAEQRDGWLLRATPGVAFRRNSSALPLQGACDIQVVERFYTGRGEPAIVAVAPAETRGELDAVLAARGWTAEGHTDVLVAPAAALAGAPSGGVRRVDPAAWPSGGIREQIVPRARDEVHAFAEGERGAVLCIRTGELGGIFRLHVAPEARREGVASRLLAACARIAPVLYAQVEVDNAPAQALFARAGFTRSHGYHYRRPR
ncbi:MAG TPA: GNAT family N-acetyltransferase [Solirubrobacteraceae bacterium]